MTSTTSWAPAASPPTAASMARLRRAPRHLLLGLALIVGFSLLFSALALRADPATGVLAVAGPVPAGATISDADLTVVRMVPDAGMEVLTEADRSTVVGRTAAVPLVGGTILSPAHVGAPNWPPPGESVVAVAFASGRVPAGLVAGSRVTVLLTSTPGPASDQGGGAPVAVAASVVQVDPPNVSGSVVVSLLLRASDARLVAAAGDEVSVLLENPAGRG